MSLNFNPPKFKVQFILAHVAGEEQILQAIVINIANSNTAAIVQVFVGEHVEALVFFKVVTEIDARLLQAGNKLNSVCCACDLLNNAGYCERGQCYQEALFDNTEKNNSAFKQGIIY
jgi:hypothetical protein